jgi:hypothetical protein
MSTIIGIIVGVGLIALVAPSFRARTPLERMDAGARVAIMIAVGDDKKLRNGINPMKGQPRAQLFSREKLLELARHPSEYATELRAMADRWYGPNGLVAQVPELDAEGRELTSP